MYTVARLYVSYKDKEINIHNLFHNELDFLLPTPPKTSASNYASFLFLVLMIQYMHYKCTKEQAW